MTHWEAHLVLFGAAVTWLALPLIPALVELLRPTDMQPLRVAQDHNGNIRNFAFGFKAFVQKLQPVIAEAAEKNTSLTGKLPKGDDYIVVAPGATEFLTAEEKQQKAVQRVVVTAGHVTLPDSILFSKEMYAAASVRGGSGDIFRALLCEEDVYLQPRSVVMRWIHAEGKIVVSTDCVVYGRVSAEHSVQLAGGCRFERVHSPVIQFGAVPAEYPQPPIHPGLEDSISTVDLPLPHRILHGTLEIPLGGSLEGHVVVTGAVNVGAGAVIVGSLKSTEDMRLGDGVIVHGSIVSSNNLYIGSECFIRGPVIAERTVFINGPTRLGSPTTRTTVSAMCIHVAPGVIAHGTVWAREDGWVGSE